MAGALDDFADGWVMDVADFWKQVVLDLEIQTAAIPRCQPAFRRKIRCGLHLMNGPFVVDFASIRIRTREGVVFRDVRQLENGGHCKTEDNMHEEEKGQNMQYRKKKHGDHQHVAEIENFSEKKKP